jgi:hypothetical protein
MKHIRCLSLLVGLAGIVLAVASFGSTAFGQAVSVGNFEGTVTDQNGAVIPGATVTACLKIRTIFSPRANSGNSFGTNSRNTLFKVITGYLGGAGNPFQAQFGARFSF